MAPVAPVYNDKQATVRAIDERNRHGKLALRRRAGDCDERPLMLGNAVLRGRNLRMLAIIATFGRGQGSRPAWRPRSTTLKPK